MVREDTIRSLVGDIMKERQLFLVEVSLKTPGRIALYLDSLKGVTIDDCAAVSRKIESWLNSNGEDYEIEVSSPGPERSLLLPEQFVKHTGRKVDVLKKDGIRLQGLLKHFVEGVAGIETEQLVRDEKTGKRKKIATMMEISLDQIKRARIIISH